MATALELSDPKHQGRFELTVYQLGFRLGGKGASGRGRFDRIEEHGLHLWLGYYDNAFRMMRKVYEELDRDPARVPIATWRDAFFAAPHTGIGYQQSDGSWRIGSVCFPALPGEPGDPIPSPPLGSGSLGGVIARALRVVVSSFRQIVGIEPVEAPTNLTPSDILRRAESSLAVAATEVTERWLDAQLATVGMLIQHLLESGPAGRSLAEQLRVAAIRILDVIMATMASFIPDNGAKAAEALQPSLVILASIRGIVADRVDQSQEGLDALDEENFIDWLARHGLGPGCRDWGTIRALHGLAFAFEDGDPQRPRAGAGQSLRQLIRAFFCYRGSLFYKMRAGMGDIVFAPIYEVLKRRGVRFEYFHRLERVHLGPVEASGRSHVRALRFRIQARTRDGSEYRPLVSVRGLPCWPSEPDWSQLEHGDTYRSAGRDFESFQDQGDVAERVLRVSEDYDFAVLGVGVGAVPHVCAELVERDPRWKRMVETTKTVVTQAVQLWMRPDLPTMGWRTGPVAVTAFVPHLDTWADMTHLIPQESWPEDDQPGSIAYFCAVMPKTLLDRLGPDQPGYQARANAEVARLTQRFAERDLRYLWPGAMHADGRFRWDWVMDHMVNANVQPSDHYCLSVPGSQKHRISPLDPTYDNFTVCGDWTQCSLNFGCVEAAVTSGLLAAHALSKSPALEDIVGYDGL